MYDNIAQTERTFGSKMVNETLVDKSGTAKGNDHGDSDCHMYDVEGIPIRIFADNITGSVWLHTSEALYKVNSVEEDRYIWHTYLEKALNRGSSPFEGHIDSGSNGNSELMFTQALNYCKNDQDRSTVLQYQAEHFLLHGQPKMAAQYYARSDADFDIVILRLLNMISASEPDSIENDGLRAASLLLSSSSSSSSSSPSSSSPPSSSALLCYLQEKLDKITQGKSKSKSTMICTW
eukprot:CAMPEP_0119040692 /NCGR_PEP_ID=MMETSP1177-20130426/10707_1 /TAXON_ID=2985 /ORGANISM="Ochromonas sp, Strain CCMP1899" /LENGTH=234 /DNA_ID=CAMNT_0007006001 /DNA_START=1520 /DNA_END=2221 /DNA_ORIENTATION=-